jgi:hypothetical protein
MFEVLCHVEATFFFVLQEEHPRNVAVIYFPENSYNIEPLKIP